MTLHITLAAERMIDPTTDDLGRDRIGFADTMSPLALYDANHGCWKLGPKAQTEQFYIASFGGIVRQAVEIESVVPASQRSDRSVIHGHILEAGHPVYDRYVGQQSPVQGMRNPITYISDEAADAHPCRCGCGAMVVGKDFLAGHDQTALHDRVRQIGSVSDFLTWFDIVRGDPTTLARR